MAYSNPRPSGLDRHCTRGGRRGHRRPRDRRPARDDSLDSQRTGDSFRGVRRQADGPRHLRRQRDHARRRRRSRRHGDRRPGGEPAGGSALGSGKRTEMEEYRITHRGGKGIITMRVTEKTGRVVGVLMVTDEDQIMLITTGGKTDPVARRRGAAKRAEHAGRAADRSRARRAGRSDRSFGGARGAGGGFERRRIERQQWWQRR